MIRRLHYGALNTIFRKPGKRTATRTMHHGHGALKGSERRVIVLHPPGGVFSEAVFVLRDDYLHTPGISREELLRQACAAAEEYTRASLPESSNGARVIIRVVLASLLLSAVAAVLYLSGVI